MLHRRQVLTGLGACALAAFTSDKLWAAGTIKPATPIVTGLVRLSMVAKTVNRATSADPLAPCSVQGPT